MDEFELTQSFFQQDEKNEFLNQDFKYENCPHCQRNFFQGKLQYHLKLCKPSNPMVKSSLRNTKKPHLSANVQKITPPVTSQLPCQPQPGQSPHNKYKKCEYCWATYPLSMMKRHSEKCSLKPNSQRITLEVNNIKSKTNIDFQFKKNHNDQSCLPRIRNSAKQTKKFQRKFVSQDFKEGRSSYTVKIRQDLSCFKKALEVQQVQCPYCSRKFSKDASLRHIPICQKIKHQQIQQIAKKKYAKSQIYKINVPVKKSVSHRQKILISVTQAQNQNQIKSARLSKPQNINKQKVSNMIFLKKQSIKQNHFNIKSFKKQNKSYQTEDKQYEILQEEKKKVQVIPFNNMNITFSKSFNNSSIMIQKIEVNQPQINNDQKLENNFQKQIQQADKKKDAFDASKQKSIETENEFLQVSLSKKRFFEQINLDLNYKSAEEKKNLQQDSTSPSLKNLKTKPVLKEFHEHQKQKNSEQKE